MMMKKYLAAAVFASSLLAAPAFAQTATSCDAMLKDFDSHLTSNNIQPTDARVTQARTQAEQACMSGDMTTAESTLDRAVADLGIPPRTGKASGNTGATESGGTTSQGAGTTNNNATSNTNGSTTGTGQSGTQNSNNNSNNSSTNSGTQGSNSGQSGSSSSTQ
jgi:hypothetical protein